MRARAGRKPDASWNSSDNASDCISDAGGGQSGGLTAKGPHFPICRGLSELFPQVWAPRMSEKPGPCFYGHKGEYVAVLTTWMGRTARVRQSQPQAGWPARAALSPQGRACPVP